MRRASRAMERILQVGSSKVGRRIATRPHRRRKRTISVARSRETTSLITKPERKLAPGPRVSARATSRRPAIVAELFQSELCVLLSGFR